MWKNFIIMINLFYLLGIYRAVGQSEQLFSKGFHPGIEAYYLLH